VPKDDIQNHGAFIWSVADLLRGNYKQSEYGRVILPLVVIRRLDCVLEPTKEAVLKKLQSLKGRIENVEPVLQAASGEQFYNTSKLDLPKLLDDPANIDANLQQKLYLWLDVRCGLPFASNSVDSIYSTHMIEHFYPDELERLLAECVRVLKPGAGLRLVVPSLRSAIMAYQQNQRDWFYESFPRHFDSLGGRFSNFVFCDGQHRTAFDFSYLDEVLRAAGFGEVEQSAEGGSRLYGEGVPAFERGDSRELPHSLYVEAFKPRLHSS
jgi:SAM-dependent methyltransferase